MSLICFSCVGLFSFSVPIFMGLCSCESPLAIYVFNSNGPKIVRVLKKKQIHNLDFYTFQVPSCIVKGLSIKY